MMNAMEKALNSSRLRTEPSFILLYWKVLSTDYMKYAVLVNQMTVRFV